VIVSNPPDVTAAEMETLDPEVRDFEPRLALCGGGDGLDFYRSICRDWVSALEPGGTLILECARAQESAVRSLACALARVTVIATGSVPLIPNITKVLQSDVRCVILEQKG
jgi:release factor glutamine methyltransferase